MEFEWAAAEQRFRAEVQDFLATELPARWHDLIPGEEAASDFTRSFCRKLAAAGLFVPHWPAQYGGRDASPWQFVVLGEELWKAGEPRGSQYMNVNWIGPAIMTAGSDEQKDYHLRRIAAGDVFWCQGFSELGAGTDLASLQTRAMRRGNAYEISGTKVWTSYAQHAEFCFLLARTDPASRGARGISIFLVPTAAAGFKIERIPSVLDIHEFNRMTLERVVVPESARLGREHHGWQIIKSALAHERIGGPRYARAALVVDRLAGQVASRQAADQQRFAPQIGRARAACEAARILTYRVFNDRAKRDQQDDVAVSVARVAIVRAERAAAELALSLSGSASVELGSIGNSQLKTSMIAGLGGGSIEVQLNLIARGLLDQRQVA
jgi:alkylation response protein AidB-like acyl-CoA dehydrogenase